MWKESHAGIGLPGPAHFSRHTLQWLENGKQCVRPSQVSSGYIRVDPFLTTSSDRMYYNLIHISL